MTTFSKGFSIPAMVLAACALVAAPSRADEIAEQGRSILGSHQDTVVTLRIVLNQKMSFPGMGSRNNESKVEATGTVIAPDGLTVMSLSETDPSALMKAMMAGSGQADQLQMETEIRDVQIMLEDGTEIPAQVILRDQDLDMAFVRPIEKPEMEFPHVDLEAGGAPEYLDPVITLNRLGSVANRAYAVSIERIQAIVERPRKFYIPGNAPTQTGLGSPVFTVEGDFVGVLLLRVVSGEASGGLGSMLGGNENVAAIIVPAIDIADGAAQVPPYEE